MSLLAKQKNKKYKQFLRRAIVFTIIAQLFLAFAPAASAHVEIVIEDRPEGPVLVEREVAAPARSIEAVVNSCRDGVSDSAFLNDQIASFITCLEGKGEAEFSAPIKRTFVQEIYLPALRDFRDYVATQLPETPKRAYVQRFLFTGTTGNFYGNVTYAYDLLTAGRPIEQVPILDYFTALHRAYTKVNTRGTVLVEYNVVNSRAEAGFEPEVNFPVNFVDPPNSGSFWIRAPNGPDEEGDLGLVTLGDYRTANRRTAKGIIALDRFVHQKLLQAPPTGATSGTGNVSTGNKWMDKFMFHAVDQLVGFYNRTPPDEISFGAWFTLATLSHRPNYTSGEVVEHNPDLNVLGGPSTALSVEWDRSVSSITDDGLARFTNACSPNNFFDRISGTDDLRKFVQCLTHEKDFVDGGNTNTFHTIWQNPAGNPLAPDFTFEERPALIQLHRHPDVSAAIQRIIDAANSCINTTADDDHPGGTPSAPTSCGVDDEAAGQRAGEESGVVGNVEAARTRSPLMNAIFMLINVILAAIIQFLLWLTALALDMFQAVLNYTGFTTEGFVIAMWRAIRDFVNLFFILALLIIAIANIVQYQINTYAIKTILPKFILIVLAVNFSRLFTGIVIDAANVVEAGVYQIGGMGPHGSGGTATCTSAAQTQGTFTFGIPDRITDGSVLCRLVRGLKFEDIQSISSISDPEHAPDQVDFFWVNMVLIIMLIMMFFGFLALAVTFTIRIIILWALVIVSPLYVISKLFPFTSSIGSQWEGKFFKYATLQVGVAFFLTLAAMSAGLIGERIFPNLSGAATGSVGTLHAGGLNTWSDYLQLAFIMAMVYAAVFTAAKSDYGTGLIDRIASYGRQPLQGVRLGARGVGGAFGFLGTAGRRLQAVQRPGLIGGAARFVGGFIAAPSNVYEGGKAVVGELKRGAEERKTRFGLAAGEKLARPFGGAVREKLKARVEEEQQKIVTQREADMRLRLSIPEIQGRLKAAADTRNAYEYMAAATALSKLGALDFTATTGRKIVGDDGKERAETIKDRLFAQELARTGNREQAKNAVDALERANQSVFESELKQGYDFAKRTDDKKAIRAKLEEFVARGNKAGALGVIQAGFEGRLEGGAAEAMEYWERVQREGKLNITGDDRRRFAKDIAKDSIATVGIMMGRESGEQKYLNDVFQVAKEIGVVASGAATYSDAIGGASSDKEKEVLEKIISSLAATGKVIDSTGRQRFLSESTAGRSLLDEVAKAQLNAFGAVKLSGDDGNLSGMVQLVDTGALARSHTMDSAGNFTADSKMVRETFKALIENTLRTTGEAKKYADDQLTKFQEAYLGNMTSQAKREGVAKVFGEMKSVISKDVDATAAKAKMDEVFNNMAALAKEKELAEFREKARIQAEEAERAKIVGGGSKTTLT